jgi:hypothetical protein
VWAPPAWSNLRPGVSLDSSSLAATPRPNVCPTCNCSWPRWRACSIITCATLTRVGGIDRCVSEFIRVTDTLLPERVFFRVIPELANGGRTPAGVPVRGQLLGSDPGCLADNAARLASLGPTGVDLNFGCPAKIVNRHGGGAALLDDPELLHRIMAEVRRAVPAHLPVSAKMRLGNERAPGARLRAGAGRGRRQRDRRRTPAPGAMATGPRPTGSASPNWPRW